MCIRSLALVTVLLAVACPCRANPVPDEVGQEFRELVRVTTATGKCPDAARLAQHFGSFGLDLLAPAEVRGIEENFPVFAPIFVESQRPGNRLSYQVQALYRKHADRDERALMVQTLREWLTVPVLKDEAQNVVRLAGPASALAAEAQRSRATAAEILSAWRDHESASLMTALASADTLLDEFQWHIERSQLCLADSTARTFLYSLPDGSVRLFKKQADLKATAFKQTNLKQGRRGRFEEPGYVLSSLERDELWTLLAKATVINNTNRTGSNDFLVVEFTDGVQAEFSPTEPGHLVYKDNTSLDYRRRLTLQSNELWNWFQRHLAEHQQANQSK